MRVASEVQGVRPRWGPGLASRVIGRERELAALHDALEQASGGRGGVVFLVGEPGIGKSRLAQVIATAAEERAVPVLHGRAVAASTPLAYRPLAEALCGAVRSGVVPDDTPDLAAFRPILGWLVPEWREAEARVDDSVVALAEGVLRFLRVAARRRGGLVVLEDLHWADPETLRVVEYLADNLALEPVLCLGTVRDEAPSPGLELARDLHARRVSRLLELTRLTPEEVAQMAAVCLGADRLPEEVIALAARADGVPFLVEELLATAVTSGALVAEAGSWQRSAADEGIVPPTRPCATSSSDATRTPCRSTSSPRSSAPWSRRPRRCSSC